MNNRQDVLEAPSMSCSYDELGAAPGDEIETLPTIDTTTRTIQAGNLEGNHGEEDVPETQDKQEDPM